MIFGYFLLLLSPLCFYFSCYNTLKNNVWTFLKTLSATQLSDPLNNLVRLARMRLFNFYLFYTILIHHFPFPFVCGVVSHNYRQQLRSRDARNKFGHSKAQRMHKQSTYELEWTMKRQIRPVEDISRAIESRTNPVDECGIKGQ